MSSQASKDRPPGGHPIQPGGQEPERRQPDQQMPEDPQDWQDLGPFDDQEQHGGQPGRQGPRAKPRPR